MAAYSSTLDKMMRAQAEIADGERRANMAKAVRAYDGEAFKPLTTKPGDPDDNVSVNYSAVVVDKGASFLFGKPLKIEVGAPGDGESAGAGEDVLEGLWPAEQRAEDLIDLATNGGVFGHVWAKIALSGGVPEVVVLDPLNMSAEWSPHNIRRVEKYVCQYNAQDEMGNPVIYRETTSRQGRNGLTGSGWLVVEEHSRPGSMVWVEDNRYEWHYEFAPVFQVKNLPKANEFYGKADLTPYVLDLCKYLARVDSIINRILRIHGFPRPVARGVQKQQLEMGSDNTLFLPHKDQVLELLEMKGDLENALKFRKLLREGLAEVSHVPEVATSKVEDVGQLSGRALKILYGPLLERTEAKRLLYGRMLRQLIQALVEVGGRGRQPVKLHWGEALPGDAKEEAEVAILKKSAGVSEATLLSELGYNPADEQAKRKTEQKSLGQELLGDFNRG
jgi:hypothetical protein